MSRLHKIRHVLPPNAWVAVYARASAPFYHVIPLSDRALVTMIADDEEYEDRIVGFVAYGGYSLADEIDPDSGLTFVGYFNQLYSQHFPQFVEQLDQYLERVAAFGQSQLGPSKEQFQIPEEFSQPVMEFEDREVWEEDDAGIE